MKDAKELLKNAGNVLMVLGVLLVVYAVIGRFAKEPTIGFGVIRASARSGLILANSLMLMAVITRLWSR